MAYSPYRDLGDTTQTGDQAFLSTRLFDDIVDFFLVQCVTVFPQLTDEDYFSQSWQIT